MSREDQSLTAIFAAPALLAALSLIGLTLALLDDGAGDVIGAALLAAPVAAILWARLRSGRQRPRRGL
jgi:predicted naringenin-chalcone synthase